MIFPQVATYLPKPGKWMNVFKQVLGWGFFFTMLWLFYVLTSQITYLMALLILCMMFSFLFLFWLQQRFPSHRRIYIVSAFVLAFAPFVAMSLEAMKEQPVISQQEHMEKTLNTIKESVKQGKIVFVDVTADWCLTCKANEFLVLDAKNVKNLIKNNNVVFIKLDWTSKDPIVYEYLRSFNRNGIPFYVVYGPHTPSGQPLLQILTYSMIEDAFKKAK
jgi:thiol:disulfide interchange protein